MARITAQGIAAPIRLVPASILEMPEEQLLAYVSQLSLQYRMKPEKAPRAAGAESSRVGGAGKKRGPKPKGGLGIEDLNVDEDFSS